MLRVLPWLMLAACASPPEGTDDPSELDDDTAESDVDSGEPGGCLPICTDGDCFWASEEVESLQSWQLFDAHEDIEFVRLVATLVDCEGDEACTTSIPVEPDGTLELGTLPGQRWDLVLELPQRFGASRIPVAWDWSADQQAPPTVQLGRLNLPAACSSRVYPHGCHFRLEGGDFEFESGFTGVAWSMWVPRGPLTVSLPEQGTKREIRVEAETELGVLPNAVQVAFDWTFDGPETWPPLFARRPGDPDSAGWVFPDGGRMSPGPWELSADPGFESEVVRVDLPNQLEPVTVPLTVRTRSVEITVESDAGLGPAWVGLVDTDLNVGAASMRLDEPGTFTVIAPYGTFTARLTGNTFPTVEQQVIVDDDLAPITLVAEPPPLARVNTTMAMPGARIPQESPISLRIVHETGLETRATVKWGTTNGADFYVGESRVRALYHAAGADDSVSVDLGVVDVDGSGSVPFLIDTRRARFLVRLDGLELGAAGTFVSESAVLGNPVGQSRVPHVVPVGAWSGAFHAVQELTGIRVLGVTPPCLWIGDPDEAPE